MKFTMTDEARRACEIISGLDYQALQRAPLGDSRSRSVADVSDCRWVGRSTPRGSVYLQLGRISSLQKARETVQSFR